MKKYFAVTIMVFLLVGCQNYPKDPESTLEKIQNQTLLVGYSENFPWVIESEEGVAGIEPSLIKDFAAQQHANVKWIKNTENELFQDLIDRKLHLVIAGLTTDTPWKEEKIGVTRPYLTTSKQAHIIALQQGENAFLIRLEKFLLDNEDQIQNMLNEYEKDSTF